MDTRDLFKARVVVSSESLGWKDVHFEIGGNDEWETRDLVIPSHYVGLNMGSTDLPFERKENGRYRRIVMPPAGMWLNPAGAPFSHRVPHGCEYLALMVSPESALELLAQRLDRADPVLNFMDDQLHRLLQVLTVEVRRGGPGGRLFREAVIAAILIHIARHYWGQGEADTGRKNRRLDPAKMKQITDYIEDNLTDISISQLAALMDLEVSGFIKLFRGTAGVSPYQYVMSRRLDRARRLLAFGDLPIVDIALAAGFSDQSHLTRLFKRKYGQTPAGYRRSYV
ncbi:MAG: AraC family transcriptional regulator [Thermodesulfobacteriota bacterium]